MIESIECGGRQLALYVPSEFSPSKTQFLTPDDYRQQLGFIVYPAGSEIATHRHKQLGREITGMSEVLILKKGRCYADIYDNDFNKVRSLEMKQGDVLLLVGGGHGFRILDDCVFVEIKQGPFLGAEEKVLRGSMATAGK